MWAAERGDRVLGVVILSGPLLDRVGPRRRRRGGRAVVIVAPEAQGSRGFRVVGGSDGSANEEGAPDVLLAWGPALPTANRGGAAGAAN